MLSFILACLLRLVLLNVKGKAVQLPAEMRNAAFVREMTAVIKLVSRRKWSVVLPAGEVVSSFRYDFDAQSSTVL